MSDALIDAKNILKLEKTTPGYVEPGNVFLARAVVRQDEELSAIREKYRWRRYPDEVPGEEDCTCLIIVKLYGIKDNPYRTILADYHSAQNIFCAHDKHGTGFRSEVRRWRPLDLPEEA